MPHCSQTLIDLEMRVCDVLSINSLYDGRDFVLTDSYNPGRPQSIIKGRNPCYYNNNRSSTHPVIKTTTTHPFNTTITTSTHLPLTVIVQLYGILLKLRHQVVSGHEPRETDGETDRLLVAMNLERQTERQRGC